MRVTLYGRATGDAGFDSPRPNLPEWWKGRHGGLKNLCFIRACGFDPRFRYMDYSASNIEYLFAEVPETDNRELEDMYYLLQRKYVNLAYSIARKVPDHPAKDEAMKFLMAAFNMSNEALFRTHETS